jgi:hypothetical protein
VITARIEFKPGRGRDFCDSDSQDVVEVRFATAEELIDSLMAFEDAIRDCTAYIPGRRGQKGVAINLGEISRRKNGASS